MRIERRIYSRNKRGSVITEWAAGLVLLIPGALLCLLLLANVGVALFYKDKLATVSSQAAQAAADFYSNGATGVTLQAQTRTSADGYLSALGMPPSSNVLVDTDSTAGTVTVTVEVATLPLVFTGGVLPQKLTLSDVGVAPMPYTAPILGYMSFHGTVGTNNAKWMWLPIVKYLPPNPNVKGWRIENGLGITDIFRYSCKPFTLVTPAS